VNLSTAIASRSVHSRLAVQVLTSEFDFDRLRWEWDELVDHSEQRVFFLRWVWNRLWWDLFRPPRSRLNLITFRDDSGRLVGLAPLYSINRRTLGVSHIRDLLFLGTGVYAQTSEYLDIITRRGFESHVANSLIEMLSASSNWDRLWLREIPSTSAVLDELRQALGDSAAITPCNRSHHVNTTIDWDSFVESLSRSTRKHLKRQTRKFYEKYQCRFRKIEDASELEPALDALVHLHQARWRSKGQPGSFAITGFEDLVRGVARHALREGRLRLWVLDLNGKIAAVRLAVFDNGIVHAIQGGFDPEYTKDSLGSVMLGMCIRDCIEDSEVHAYDFMGGTDTYKDWWTTLGRETVTLTLLRPGIRSSLYKLIFKSYASIRRIVKFFVPASLRRFIYEKTLGSSLYQS
jgi:hypothetical protein